MKRILLALIIPILFCSCEPQAVLQGRKVYKAYFNHILKDPGSLEIYDEDYSVNGHIVKWTVDYGARNSYGGNVRKTISFTTFGSETIMIDILYGGGIYEMKDLK